MMTINCVSCQASKCNELGFTVLLILTYTETDWERCQNCPKCQNHIKCQICPTNVSGHNTIQIVEYH